MRQVGHTGFAWQRGFYDRIVRDERELRAVQGYIIDNPVMWMLDADIPDGARQ